MNTRRFNGLVGSFGDHIGSVRELGSQIRPVWLVDGKMGSDGV